MLAGLLWRGLRDLSFRPLATLLTVMAVMLTTFLGGLFVLVLHNLDAQILKNRGKVQFQVYWRGDAKLDVVKQQWQKLRETPGLSQMTVFTPESALEVLQESLGQGVNLSSLRGSSPLPATALLNFALPGEDQAYARELYSRLSGMPMVDKVHFNPLQLDMAQGWQGFSRGVLWPLVLILALLTALVVGHAIKLSLLLRRDEVEILGLIGAGGWYIRLPLIVAGAVQALLGAMVALGLLKLAQVWLEGLLNFAPLWIELEFLPLGQCLGLLGLVGLVGMLSSFVALRH